MIYTVEGEFYNPDEWEPEYGWVALIWKPVLRDGWEYNHRYVNQDIVKNIYKDMSAEEILKEIMVGPKEWAIDYTSKKEVMGDVKVDPDFTGASWNERSIEPSWNSEWKAISTIPMSGSPTDPLSLNCFMSTYAVTRGA